MVKFKKIVLFYVCLSLSLSMFNLQYFKHNFIVKANEVLEENSNDAIEEVVDKKILSEVEELRDVSSKTFFMSDRSFQKIIYANDVHYLNEEGIYEEIDHTLIDNSNIATYAIDDVIGYEADSNMNLKFAKKAHKSNMISIKKNDHKLMWGIEGIENKNDATMAVKDNNDNEITKVMDKISQTITYPEVFENIDIEYITTSNGIKENIIIKQKQDKNEFVFHFKVKNIELQLNEDGSIYAVNDHDEVVYIMPKAYMYDANGNTSYDVNYELEKEIINIL